MTRGRFHKLIYALRQNICALRPTFEKLFAGAKVRRKAQKFGVGLKTVYEIDPSGAHYDLGLIIWLSVYKLQSNRFF